MKLKNNFIKLLYYIIITQSSLMSTIKPSNTGSWLSRYTPRWTQSMWTQSIKPQHQVSIKLPQASVNQKLVEKITQETLDKPQDIWATQKTYVIQPELPINSGLLTPTSAIAAQPSIDPLLQNLSLGTKTKGKDSKKDGSKKTNWYKRKLFKYPMIFLGSSALFDNYMEQQEYHTTLNESDDAIKDPELYAVMLQIKKDLNITNKVNFRIWHKQPHKNVIAQFKRGRKLHDSPLPEIPATILISPNYKSMTKSDLICTIAHELEHMRQYLRYPGSYHLYDDISEIRIKKAEMGADAAAADYLYCSECLTDLASSIKGFIVYDPHDTEHGYFTTEYGYFSPEDYQPYIDRACENDAMCKAHREKTHRNPNTPLEHFLPTR